MIKKYTNVNSRITLTEKMLTLLEAYERNGNQISEQSVRVSSLWLAPERIINEE